jgi:rsbT co-antagonist protein RsbR
MSAESSAPPDPENAALRAQVADLQRRLEVFQGLLDALPFGVFFKDTDLVYRVTNTLGLAASGLRDPAEFLGRTDFDQPWNREQAAGFVADDREVLARGQPKPHIVESVRDANGEVRWVETFKAPVFDRAGALVGLVGTFRDITADKVAQHAELAGQREAMRELATPLLPVADGVVVLPLIGTLDPDRVAFVMEALLAGVVQHRARVAILDITGLHTVDTAAAEGLVRAARAIGLLGAEAVLTGVRPTVARTLIELGAELGGLVVLGDLKAGIAHAIARTTRR